jgi:hypothetical protein
VEGLKPSTNPPPMEEFKLYILFKSSFILQQKYSYLIIYYIIYLDGGGCGGFGGL